jgi:hypothetical protein
MMPYDRLLSRLRVRIHLVPPLSPRAEELRKRLQNAGKTFAVDIFKNAGHAFFAD